VSDEPAKKLKKIRADRPGAIPDEAWDPKFKPGRCPTWWTPDEVLRRLGEGQAVGEIASKAGKERGFTKRQALADIDAWKKSPVWAVRFQEALAVFERKGGRDVVGKGWYNEFYRAMEATEGKVQAACDRMGISSALVYARLDRRNVVYDADFAEQVRILEGARYSKIRESFLDEAARGDTRAAAKVLEAAMPELHNAKHEVRLEGQVDHRHVHMILTPEVVAASASRTKTLLAGRQPVNAVAGQVGQQLEAYAGNAPLVIEVPR
jgi:hypothetical protein